MRVFKVIIKGYDDGQSDIKILGNAEYGNELLNTLMYTAVKFAYENEVNKTKFIEAIKAKYKEILEEDYKNDEN